MAIEMAMAMFQLLIIAGFSFCISANFVIETKYPCAFIDTINVTGKTRDNNNNKNNNNNNNNNSNYSIYLDNGNDEKNIAIDGNLTYEHNNWIEIPRDLVAIYDFIIRNGIRMPVKRHLRACICKLKPCIRFCCAQGHFYDVTNRTCIAAPDINDSLDQSTMVVRSNKNGSFYKVLTSKHFNAFVSSPCERIRSVVNDQKELIQWTLFENGTIASKHHHFTKHYCYSPYRLPNMTWIWQPYPIACPVEKLPFLLGVKEWTYVVCLILATICMAIIFFVHLFCTEMRNTFYGVAIKAYSLCIIIGYSLMMHLVLTDPLKMSKTSCTFIPCFILLFQLLSFYILTFISFHFYLNFHGIVLTKLMFWLIFFPIASLAVGWSLYVRFEHYGSKPIFGGDTCWFDPRNWAIMIYLYAPTLIACSASVFFYILTLIRIREQQEKGSKILATALEENRYTAFWQFFSYTFIAWLVCVISFVINYYRETRTHINYAVCLIIILHGFGTLFALIGKNKQIQNFLRRIEDGIDDDDEDACESSLPMRPLDRN